MKDIRNSIHKPHNEGGRSHDCFITEIKGKKVKITYIAENAVERCSSEIFDGYKWNSFLSMMDLGEVPNPHAYNLLNETQRKERATKLIKQSEKAIFNIL